MTPDSLFDAGPSRDVCGASSPPAIAGYVCDREPGHGGPHWHRGPRSTTRPGWRLWDVSWMAVDE